MRNDEKIVMLLEMPFFHLLRTFIFLHCRFTWNR